VLALGLADRPHPRYRGSVSDRPTINDFGLLIAYLLPGFTALWGAQFLVTDPRVLPWQTNATVGDFLFSTVAAVTAGLAVSTLRWLVIDSIHHRTGVRPPDWDFSRLHDRTEAFGLLLDGHYRYFQFYANMVVALGWALVARHLAMGAWWPTDWLDTVLLGGMVLFFLGSRDTLRKYYRRAGDLLRVRRAKT
jgi:hypothetical protein